jgi:hypothetical protein
MPLIAHEFAISLENLRLVQAMASLSARSLYKDRTGIVARRIIFVLMRQSPALYLRW